MIVDKKVNQQVLGALIKHPTYLSQVDKYNLGLIDFSSRFERYIFLAIQGLYNGGAQHITAMDICNYYSSDLAVQQFLKNNNVLEYVSDIEEFVSEDNFQYYYSKLKKLNLLRDMQKQGIDTKNYYAEDLLAENAKSINEKFESLSVSDIINEEKKKLLKLENDYSDGEEVVVTRLDDDIDNFIADLNETVSIGTPIQGAILNEILNGAESQALTIRSGGSGIGKTRHAVADACFLAFPMRYNPIYRKWEQTGNNEKVLFIITEQTIPQIKKMILAYLTGINESRFKYGDFVDDEKKVLSQAVEIIKKYADNFIIVKMPAPTIDLMKCTIREQCILNDIDHVFFDYIFINPALLGEFRGFSLRNDELLLLMATALKDLAVELNVSMFTSTQVNANADDNKNIRNEASLAGGRSTINKADNGCIMARPTREELEALKDITEKYGVPNVVTDVFKVRSGQWTQVRIWSIMDLGTMRRKDLFLTDSNLEAIQDFAATSVRDIIEQDEESAAKIKERVDELNGLQGNN